MSDNAIVVVQNDQTLENRVMHGDASIDQDGLVTVVSPTMLEIVAQLSSAQINALNVTPRTLIPAPGAGKYIQFYDALLQLTYGGTPFSQTPSLNIAYQSQIGVNLLGDDTYPAGGGNSYVLSLTANGAILCMFTEGGLGYLMPISFAQNQAVMLYADSAPAGGNNSVLKVRVRYQILDATI